MGEKTTPTLEELALAKLEGRSLERCLYSVVMEMEIREGGSCF